MSAVETKAAREQLKRAIAAAIEAVWPMEKTGVPALTAFERGNGMELVQDKLTELAPQTDAQRQSLACAQQIVGDLSQTRKISNVPLRNALQHLNQQLPN